MDASVGDIAAGRSGQTGLLAASAGVPGTFARSLTPRNWVDQGLITGIAAGMTYLLTVTTHDGIEFVASKFAPTLPLLRDASAADRQRVAVLCTNLAVIPVGLAVQRALVSRPGEPTVRCLTRQAAWRWAATGFAGAALAAAQGGAAVVDRGLGIGGRLTRFPIAVPAGLAIALVTESRRQGHEASDVDMEGMPSASPARSLTAACGVVLVGSGLAYAERRLSDVVGVALADVLPGSERFWNLTADLAVLGGFAAGVGALFQRVIHNWRRGRPRSTRSSPSSLYARSSARRSAARRRAWSPGKAWVARVAVTRPRPPGQSRSRTAFQEYRISRSRQ
jgi:hypothetical protein